MDDPSYSYIYCELFDWVGLIMITLCVKLPHIQMHENVFQKNCMSRLRILELRLGLGKGFKKGTCQLFLQWNPPLICYPLQHLNMF
jgi:hypothetical protein